MHITIYNRLRTLKILFIGNDEWIRDSMMLFFEDEGCLLHTFETAEEALGSLENNRYDLIIADNKLPGMDGLTFFKRIRQTSIKIKKILIVFDKNKALTAAIKKTGINDVIEKPFTPDTLETSLKKIFKNDA